MLSCRKGLHNKTFSAVKKRGTGVAQIDAAAPSNATLHDIDPITNISTGYRQRNSLFNNTVLTLWMLSILGAAGLLPTVEDIQSPPSPLAV